MTGRTSLTAVLVSVLWAAAAACGASSSSAPTISTAPAVQLPTGTWPARQAERLENALDEFFAEKDPARRAVQFKDKLLPLEVGLSLEELEAIAKAPPPEGKGKAKGVARIQCDWLRDNPRGWFNFSMPEGYTPAKPWALVVAMHGSDSDGDNVVSFYSPQLNKLGFFVVYPTVTEKGRYWGQAGELVNVYRIIDWVARRYRIDFRRLVATGGSMGGVGTWSCLLNRPDIWSAGASVAGYPPAIGGDILENIRGIPFYVLHGEKDSISVEGPRKAVAELRRRKIDVVYAEAPGAGHTPPVKYWQDVNAWIAKQPPKPFSPRPMFLPGQGRPLWAVETDPLDLDDANDPILSLIRQGKTLDARKQLAAQMPKAGGNPRLYVLRALTYLPGLLEPYPYSLDIKSFDPKQGWTAANETAALADLNAALMSKAGKALGARVFDDETRLMLAKIHLKRVAETIQTDVAWARHWNSFAQYTNAISHGGGRGEAERLIHAAHAFVAKHGKMKGATSAPS